MRYEFVENIEHFAPHAFAGEQGTGLFRSHSHVTDEITLILEGEGHYSSNDQNVQVAAGDLILIPPGIVHGFVCLKAWNGISIHYDSQSIPSYCQYLLQHAYRQYPNQILISRLNRTRLERVKAAIQQLEEECVWVRLNENSYSQDLIRNALEAILLSYLTNAPGPSEPAIDGEDCDERMIQDALKEIHLTYFTSLKIADLAARRFHSESVFRKKFSKRVGLSPKQYIISVRLNEAKRLLRHTDKPVEFIASEVGFTSSSRFYELFVKHVGKTPLEWRNESYHNP
ncbi:AraC family transcriptional regulator [Paenibacillus arenilitoris]|uniref:AraC family transcriptional regulator n=1 Tax=Paenibacillus arenilitoris TaxID=2772299 RepID=A0A927HAT8_9BACL|nr:helix-turn-helix domain-containing protein [Paenibacillus arenilitoris]MBD2872944.1 AraC family transcriptional regulator [Paenibacillus arenilitoris]